MRKESGAESRGGFKVIGTDNEAASDPEREQSAKDGSNQAKLDPHADRPRITVIGLGGAGSNAVHNMLEGKLEGVEFVVANTDAQALRDSKCEHRIQLGRELTGGLGAGSRPEIGRAAAEESLEEILSAAQGASLVFIAAGMGGGTGTGAAPVVADAIRKKGILTVAVVTKPFRFEGDHRMEAAEQGVKDLQKQVDTLIVIPNQNLFKVATEKTSVSDAFHKADNVLFAAVRGVTDVMINPGLINLDFADFRTVMTQTGKAIIGAGEADGPQRALIAAEAAVANPLLEDSSVDGARGVLINITGGSDLTLFELDEAVSNVRSKVHPKANIIMGSAFDDSMKGKIRVSVLATGIGLAKKEETEPAAKAASTEVEKAEETPAPWQPTGKSPATATSSQAGSVPASAEEPNVPWIKLSSTAELLEPVKSEEAQSEANESPILDAEPAVERASKLFTSANKVKDPLEPESKSSEAVASSVEESSVDDLPTLDEIMKRVKAEEAAEKQESAPSKAKVGEKTEPKTLSATLKEQAPVEENDDNIDALIEEVLHRNRQSVEEEKKAEDALRKAETTVQQASNPSLAEDSAEKAEAERTSTDSLLRDLASGLIRHKTNSSTGVGKSQERIEPSFDTSLEELLGTADPKPALSLGSANKSATDKTAAMPTVETTGIEEDPFYAELDRRARERARVALEGLSESELETLKAEGSAVVRDEDADEALRQIMKLPAFLRGNDTK